MTSGIWRRMDAGGRDGPSIPAGSAENRRRCGNCRLARVHWGAGSGASRARGRGTDARRPRRGRRQPGERRTLGAARHPGGRAVDRPAGILHDGHRPPSDEAGERVPDARRPSDAAAEDAREGRQRIRERFVSCAQRRRRVQHVRSGLAERAGLHARQGFPDDQYRNQRVRRRRGRGVRERAHAPRRDARPADAHCVASGKHQERGVRSPGRHQRGRRPLLGAVPLSNSAAARRKRRF